MVNYFYSIFSSESMRTYPSSEKRFCPRSELYNLYIYGGYVWPSLSVNSILIFFLNTNLYKEIFASTIHVSN